MPAQSRKTTSVVKSLRRPVASRNRAHWVMPYLELRPRPETGDYGLYAVEVIRRNELLVMWGGDIVTSRDFGELSATAQRHAVQVEEELYLVPRYLPEPGDYVNHSCSPNAGMSGQAALVALRNIMPGEEICYDYAMSDGSQYDEFTCFCGSAECRSRVTGDDWRLPDLQRKYSGYFAPYLQRRISAAVAEHGGSIQPFPGVLAEIGS